MKYKYMGMVILKYYQCNNKNKAFELWNNKHGKCLFEPRTFEPDKDLILKTYQGTYIICSKKSFFKENDEQK